MTVKKLNFDDFKSFEAFPDSIISEIIREGEREIDARLATANASDQRALTILGFQITLAVAVGGGLVSIAGKATIDKFLLTLGAFLLLGLLTAAAFSYLSVIPKPYRYPGNNPSNWFISMWHISPNSEQNANLKFAKVEQCYCLYSAIFDNTETMDYSAKKLLNSMAITMTSIISVSLIYIFSIFISLFA